MAGNWDSQMLTKHLFLLHDLVEIDNALIAMPIDGAEAVIASISASNALSNALSIDAGNIKLQKVRCDIAKRGAMAKLASDPKQKDKIFVKECWKDWQEIPSKYKSKVKFAKDMLDKCEHLESQKVITDWCAKWGKEQPAG